ncbi:MAG: twin-arginine translocase subunit TatC [Theionarchaea archaeon]|nr:twin-arginine translocase subunit TatC [Theionarchaea archaeon]
MEKEMSFFDHLQELRNRAIAVILAVVISSAALFPFMPNLIEILRQELIEVPLHVFSPMEAIFVTFKASIYAGVVISSPVIIYEVWAFISPGLTKKERKMVITALIPTVLLFLAGAAFAYFIILPVTLKFFFSFSYRMSTPLFGLDQTLSFVFSMLFIFGVVFQFPLVIAVLARLGVVTHEFLATKRKYALVVIFVVAGIITPDPTVVSQTIVGVPLYALYEISIWVARLLEKEKET